MNEVIPSSKLDFWISHHYNVLLEGMHGVGKTSVILQAFERHDIKYAYFSCATLDPWVDFVGIPKEMEDPSGIKYLELIRPRIFAFDEVEAIVLDELNRAQPKIMNALMELLQFKSINGKKLKNLKMVWAAINPPAQDDDDPQYHVQPLDPAVKTRFQIKYHVPFEISTSYFERKYGREVTKRLTSWWKQLSRPMKLEFPPREIDHALQVLKDGGDVADALPKCISRDNFLKVVKSSLVDFVPPPEPSSGVTQNTGILTASVHDLTVASRNERAFAQKLHDLTNEEIIHLFLRVGPTADKSLSTLGQRIIKHATVQQKHSIFFADVGDKLAASNQFMNHFNRVFKRICGDQKIVIQPPAGTPSVNSLFGKFKTQYFDEVS